MVPKKKSASRCLYVWIKESSALQRASALIFRNHLPGLGDGPGSSVKLALVRHRNLKEQFWGNSGKKDEKQSVSLLCVQMTLAPALALYFLLLLLSEIKKILE